MALPFMAVEAVKGARSHRDRPPRRKTLGVGLALGAMVGSGLGLVHDMHWNPLVTSASISGGKGTVLHTFRFPTKECRTAYVSEVDGAKAEIDENFHVFGRKVPTTVWARETFSSKVTNEVCNTSIAGQEHIDPRTSHVTLGLPANAFTATVYMTNPNDPNAYRSDEGLFYGQFENLVNDINTLPTGIHYGGADRVTNALRGWAELAAFATASQACSTADWPVLKTLEQRSVEDSIVADINGLNLQDPKHKLTDRQITDADVTVEMPDTISLDNQYGNRLSRIIGALQKGGVTITQVQPTLLNCKLASSATVGN